MTQNERQVFANNLLDALRRQATGNTLPEDRLILARAK